MTGNGISVDTVKEALAALRIQRRDKIDKDDRCNAKRVNIVVKLGQCTK